MHHSRVIDEDARRRDGLTSPMTYANLRRPADLQDTPTARLMDSSRSDDATHSLQAARCALAVMGVGAYLFGEGYPSRMFQNGH